MLQLDVQLLTMLSGTVVPLLVALVTKGNLNRHAKLVVNFFLSATAGGLVVAIQHNGSVEVWVWVLDMCIAFATSLLSYYLGWRPAGVTKFLQEMTAYIGIGPRRPRLTLTHFAQAAGHMRAPDRALVALAPGSPQAQAGAERIAYLLAAPDLTSIATWSLAGAVSTLAPAIPQTRGLAERAFKSFSPSLDAITASSLASLRGAMCFAEWVAVLENQADAH